MEFNLLYLKHLLIVQCLCVCLELDGVTIIFVKKDRQSALECPFEKQKVKHWQLETEILRSPNWVPVKTDNFEANVNSDEANFLNFNITTTKDIRIRCKGTEKNETFLVMPLYNDDRNLYPSSETPYALKDRIFTLECNNGDNGVTWFTRNGTIIAKYIGIINQNYTKYFGSRQETSCRNKICTLSIINVSLDEDNMSIVCSSSIHTSMFNIRVFDHSENIIINSDEPFLEGQEGSLHCKIINGYPEKYSFRWYPNNSTSENITFPQLDRKQNNKIYTCCVSKRGNKKLHKKHWLNIEYVPDITTPENMTFIENQAANLACSAKGNPIPEVRLECGNESFPSNFPLTFNRRNITDIFCVANAKSTKHGNLTSRKKINILLKYPPNVDIHIKEKNKATIINCTAFDGNPVTYEYKLEQKWGNALKNIYHKNILSINNPSFNNTGTWECHVSNKEFHVSKSANYEISVKPIFSSIFNDPKMINVSNGESVIFKQCFYSHPKSCVKWQKNEELIDLNKIITTDFVSSEFPFKGSCTSLKIEDIEDNDFGTYTLTVENSKGKEVITFALKFREITEILLEIIIGCAVGIVLLIMFGLLAYKCQNIRVIDGAYDNHSKKPEDVDDHYVEVSEFQDTCPELPALDDHYVEVREFQDTCLELSALDDHYVEVSEFQDTCPELSALDDHYVEVSEFQDTCPELSDVDDHYVEVSEFQDTCPELPAVDDYYVEISEFQDSCPELPVAEAQYAELHELIRVCMKHPAVEDYHVEVNELKYVCMKQPAVEDYYAEINEPKYVCMKHPATEDYNVEVNEPKYMCMKQPAVEDYHVEVNEPKYVCMKHPAVEDYHVEVNEPEYVCMKHPDQIDPNNVRSTIKF